MAWDPRRSLGRKRSGRSGRSSTRTTAKETGLTAAKYVLGFLRLLEFVAAIVVIGYYASSLSKSHDNKPYKYNGTSFTYAVVVGVLAAITAIFLMVISFFGQFFAAAVLFVWEWALVLLWAALTGVMGQKYFHSKPAGGPNDWHNMRVAAGFSCASLLLWFITAVIGTVEFFVEGRHRGMNFGRSRS